MTFALVEEAVNNGFACMEAVGAQGTWLAPDTSLGFPVPSYRFGAPLALPEHEWLPVAEDCLKRESSVVEWLYQMQPAATSLKDQYYRDVVRPQVVQCLEDNDKVVPENATKEEIDWLIEELYNETSGVTWVDNGDGSMSGYATTPDRAVQCYIQATS